MANSLNCSGGNLATDTGFVAQNSKRPQLSLCISTFNGGTQDEIKESILAAGFGDDIPDEILYLWDVPIILIPGTNYPIDLTRKRMISIELHDNIYKAHGWFAELATSSQTYIEGYHITEPISNDGIKLTARTKESYLSFGYMASTSDDIGSIKIGPSLALSDVDINCSQDLKIKRVMPGVHINGEVHMLRNSFGFIGLQVGYRAYKKIQTDAIAVHTFGDNTALVLPEMNLNLNNLYFGLQAGVNLGR